MKKTIFYVFCAVMLLLFIAEKLCFITVFGDLEFALKYLSVTLPQIVVLIGSFIGEHFLIKAGHFDGARVISIFKYWAVILLYLCSIGWATFEFTVFYYSLLKLFLLWYPIGMICEPILIGRLEKKARKLESADNIK